MPESTKSLNSEKIKQVLSKEGMNQKDLAKQLGVSGQAITNWLKGTDFPRPPKLLKLAVALGLTIDELVQHENPSKPIIAFRKKGASKTNSEHIKKAEHIGMLLRPLVQYLPPANNIRPLIRSPECNYESISRTALQTRSRLEIGSNSIVKYNHLISEFNSCGAVLVPVMWGVQENHKNALHIYLPAEDVTFIFLNLDTRMEDFKFWMAHELAHVYTPDLAGTDAGENFADAYAGGLLFSSGLCKKTYNEVSRESKVNRKVGVIREIADRHHISIYTVFSQLQKFAKSEELTDLGIDAKLIHKIRSKNSGDWVSHKIFKNSEPTAEQYVQACEKSFKTSFFSSITAMLEDREVEAGYLQQILGITVIEANELYQALMN